MDGGIVRDTFLWHVQESTGATHSACTDCHPCRDRVCLPVCLVFVRIANCLLYALVRMSSAICISVRYPVVCWPYVFMVPVYMCFCMMCLDEHSVLEVCWCCGINSCRTKHKFIDTQPHTYSDTLYSLCSPQLILCAPSAHVLCYTYYTSMLLTSAAVRWRCVLRCGGLHYKPSS